MADKINVHYRQLLKEEKDPSVVVICILKGAIIFFTDLIRCFDFRVEEDFIRLSSYHGGMTSTNEVEFLTQLNDAKYKGKHLLIVEDIIDTGKTLYELMKKLKVCEPKSVEIAALVRRPDKEQMVQCRWIGLDCSDFIIGYGLDLD
jgi:hypoxanthine phosphoribosyltransferase